MLTNLVGFFPNLVVEGYRRTSQPTKTYNCIAWAASDAAQWWEPGPLGLVYWPPGAPREYTIDAYASAFETLGYEVCGDGNPEAGFEKVALYTMGGEPKHAARLLPDGNWTSKLGPMDDISHSLGGVEGAQYGTATHFMKRPIPDPS